MNHIIKYKSGFRHQLVADAYTQTAIYPDKAIITKYGELSTDGFLIAKDGYAWDGPSGPCRFIADRLPEFLRLKYLKTILRGSLFHDLIYELIRLGLLPTKWRKQGDKELKRICLEDKMCDIRAWWVYKAVRKGGSMSADPRHKKPIYTAP